VELALLLPDDVRAERAIGRDPIPFLADALGQVEHDRDRQAVVLPRQSHQRLAGGLLDVRRVDDGEAPRRQALRRDQVQHLEGVGRSRLVVLVVGHEAAAEVGREDLGRLEVLAREGRLPAARRADEHDERELGDGDLHRSKTAICVGGPCDGSSAPTGT
jgi:hypothetical protein